tara:strand:+ start:1163 stop:1612 length:450 start_codon:yes stop_codon:yes gene_type:complete
MNMNISDECIEIIKKFEGIKLTSYLCSANVWTIGYGHTKGIIEGMEINEEIAEEYLSADLKEFEGYVNEEVKVELEQFQFDALVSWTFNLGVGNLRSSTMLKKLNQAKYDEIPFEIKRWNKAAGKVVFGLVRRREAEALLFQNKNWRHI